MSSNRAALAQIREGYAALLAADPAGLALEQLREELHVLEEIRAAHDAAAGLRLAAFEAQGGPEAECASSTRARLRREFRLDAGEARQRVESGRVARSGSGRPTPWSRPPNACSTTPESPSSAGCRSPVTLVTDLGTLRGERKQWAPGSLLSSVFRHGFGQAALERLTCTAEITLAIAAKTGVPLALGRSSRYANANQMKMLCLRDGGCRVRQHPGRGPLPDLVGPRRSHRRRQSGPRLRPLPHPVT